MSDAELLTILAAGRNAATPDDSAAVKRYMRRHSPTDDTLCDQLVAEFPNEWDETNTEPEA